MRVKGFLAGALASVAALAVVSVASGASAAAAPAATRELKNTGSTLCATVTDVSYVSNVYMRPCRYPSVYQKWELQPIGGGLYHVATTGNYCLSMASARSTNGYVTMTQPCGLNLTEEQWRVTELEPSVRTFYSPQDGRYLDAPLGSDQAVMGVDVGTPMSSQSWFG